MYVLDFCWVEVVVSGGSAKFVNFTIGYIGSRANVGDLVM